MAAFLEGIEELQIILCSSSWGALQCNAKYRDANCKEKEYNSCAGRPAEPVTMQLIIDAINLINKQIKERSKNHA